MKYEQKIESDHSKLKVCNSSPSFIISKLHDNFLILSHFSYGVQSVSLSPSFHDDLNVDTYWGPFGALSVSQQARSFGRDIFYVIAVLLLNSGGVN